MRNAKAKCNGHGYMPHNLTNARLHKGNMCDMLMQHANPNANMHTQMPTNMIHDGNMLGSLQCIMDTQMPM